MTWLDALCWLAGLIVLAGCFGGHHRRGKPWRDPKHPWVLHYRDGSWEVDMSDPQWQANFRKQVRDIEKIRRADSAGDSR